jgi:hypothetical protein
MGFDALRMGKIGDARLRSHFWFYHCLGAADGEAQWPDSGP